MTTAPSKDGDGRHQALVSDRNGVIRRWNSECVRIFGYSSDEAVGQTLDLIVPPALQALHWRGFNRAVACGQLKRPGKTLRVPAVHKSGKIISLQLDDTALIGSPDGTVGEIAVTPSRGPAWVAAVSRVPLAVLDLWRRGRSR